MRFAGDVDFEVRSNEDIEKALEVFKNYIIEALPTKDATAFSLKLMFDAQGRTPYEQTFTGGIA